MNTNEIKLFTTTGCHLCDQVFDQLLSSPNAAGCQLVVIEIADDDALMDRYASRIPVLECAGRTLEAPIEADALEAWLARVRS